MRTPRHQRTRRGVTLVELVVVLLILVVLAGIVVLLTSSSMEKSHEAVTVANMRTLRDLILGQYRADMKEDVLFEFQAANSGGATRKRPLVLPRRPFAAVNSNGPPWNSSVENWPNLRYLFVNPGTDMTPNVANQPISTHRPDLNRGWNGPYLNDRSAQLGTTNYGVYVLDLGNGFTEKFGDAGEPTVMDGWGKPIVLEEIDYMDQGSGKPIPPMGYYGLYAVLRSAGGDGKLNTSDDLTLVIIDRMEMESQP